MSRYPSIPAAPKGICRVCQAALTQDNCSSSFLQRGFTICRDCNQEQITKRTKDKRILVLERLGNICACCGIDTPELLSIDHIHGGGHQEAKQLRGKNYLHKLIKMSNEDLHNKFQALCYNCNYTKGFWGVCPHNLPQYNGEELLIGDRTSDNTHLSPTQYRERGRALRRIGVMKIKMEALLAYGNKCARCQENHPLFLTLDHINNNGIFDKTGGDFYQMLKSKGYPGEGTQLQILCHNCNAYKEYTERRLHKNQLLKIDPEIYIQQAYSLSKENENEIWRLARELYAVINKYRNDHNIIMHWAKGKSNEQ